jgi:hypothetical protein
MKITEAPGLRYVRSSYSSVHLLLPHVGVGDDKDTLELLRDMMHASTNYLLRRPLYSASSMAHGSIDDKVSHTK